MSAKDIMTKLGHYRTTGAGVLGVVGATLVFIAEWAAHGVPGAEAWAALGTAYSIGGGLIASADQATVKAQVAVLDERTK